MSTKEGDPIGRVGASGAEATDYMLLLGAFPDFIAAASLSFGLGQLCLFGACTCMHPYSSGLSEGQPWT